ncbi:hypothetical protein G7046_g5079 [Stylonectria norvegica]|nr:hypothetical protein G7046_g5079 [Stylonectria norvegica]
MEMYEASGTSAEWSRGGVAGDEHEFIPEEDFLVLVGFGYQALGGSRYRYRYGKREDGGGLFDWTRRKLGLSTRSLLTRRRGRAVQSMSAGNAQWGTADEVKSSTICWAGDVGHWMDMNLLAVASRVSSILHLWASRRALFECSLAALGPKAAVATKSSRTGSSAKGDAISMDRVGKPATCSPRSECWRPSRAAPPSSNEFKFPTHVHTATATARQRVLDYGRQVAFGAARGLRRGDLLGRGGKNRNLGALVRDKAIRRRGYGQHGEWTGSERGVNGHVRRRSEGTWERTGGWEAVNRTLSPPRGSNTDPLDPMLLYGEQDFKFQPDLEACSTSGTGEEGCLVRTVLRTTVLYRGPLLGWRDPGSRAGPGQATRAEIAEETKPPAQEQEKATHTFRLLQPPQRLPAAVKGTAHLVHVLALLVPLPPAGAVGWLTLPTPRPLADLTVGTSNDAPPNPAPAVSRTDGRRPPSDWPARLAASP